MDRLSGKPIFGVEERPVLKNDTPGETASLTQPFPIKPPALVRQRISESDITTEDAKDRQSCLETLNALRNELRMTTLVVAHRRSTVELADRIMRMADGRIVSAGTHEELLASDPEYVAMLTAYDAVIAEPDDEFDPEESPRADGSER